MEKGYSQVYGVDFEETYSAVARMESVRFCLAIIPILGLHMWQVDFVAVFLNSEIQHTVYMEQPPGFIAPGNENKVCLLKKTLYGTMQDAHDWYRTLRRLRRWATRSPAQTHVFDGRWTRIQEK